MSKSRSAPRRRAAPTGTRPVIAAIPTRAGCAASEEHLTQARWNVDPAVPREPALVVTRRICQIARSWLATLICSRWCITATDSKTQIDYTISWKTGMHHLRHPYLQGNFPWDVARVG